MYADPESEFEFEYKPGEVILLKNTREFGMSNVHAYLDDSLTWLSGRMVTVTTCWQELKIEAIDSSLVQGVQFVCEGNMAEVPEGFEKTLCKVGHGKDCCVFLVCGSRGFECSKFSGSMATHLLGRLANGDINAGRIGDCRLVGRKQEGE